MKELGQLKELDQNRQTWVQYYRWMQVGEIESSVLSHVISYLHKDYCQQF